MRIERRSEDYNVPFMRILNKGQSLFLAKPLNFEQYITLPCRRMSSPQVLWNRIFTFPFLFQVTRFLCSTLSRGMVTMTDSACFTKLQAQVGCQSEATTCKDSMKLHNTINKKGVCTTGIDPR